MYLEAVDLVRWNFR